MSNGKYPAYFDALFAVRLIRLGVPWHHGTVLKSSLKLSGGVLTIIQEALH